MQHRHDLVRVLVLAVPSLVACSTADESAVSVSNERLDEAALDPGRSGGDEAPAGQGLSRISLGVVGETDLQSKFYHVFQQASPGNPETISLSFSAVFADGDALSLVLPYLGDAATFDASSMPIGRDGLMWSTNGADMYSTRGSFRVEYVQSRIRVHVAELVLTEPLQPESSLSIPDGVIEGEVERRCLLAKPRGDGLAGANGPVASYEADPTWTSDFCARFR